MGPEEKRSHASRPDEEEYCIEEGGGGEAEEEEESVELEGEEEGEAGITGRELEMSERLK